MRSVEEQIEVRAPVRAVFERWTRFEGWPSFMEELDDVRRADERHLRLWGRVAGQRREWVAAITELNPDVSVAWAGLDGPPASAVVVLEALGSARTRVVLRVDEDAPEDGGDPGRVGRTLRRLKELVERGHAAAVASGDEGSAGPRRLEGLGVIAAIRDLAVCDPEGERVGGVVDAYLDLGAMTVRHLAVATGALDGAHLVPAEVIAWDPVWRALTVPCTRDQLRGAPGAPARGELKPEDERLAAEYFARLTDWAARRDVIARRQTPPPPTPEIAEAEGRDPDELRAPAPTREIAEAELRDEPGRPAPPPA